jgi:hypothetical protein
MTALPNPFYSVTAQNGWMLNFSNFQDQKDDASYVRPELFRMFLVYKRIRDCLNGQDAIKASDYFYNRSNTDANNVNNSYYNIWRTPYLPKPNPTDLSQENEARYLSYLTRAVFYPVMCQTVLGLIGQCFIFKPKSYIPEILKPTAENMNGTLSLDQFSREVLKNNISFARCGILTDFPKADPQYVPSLQDVKEGKLRPTNIIYEPEQIINWKVREVNGQIVNSLIVLKECYDDADEMKFKPEAEERYRVLMLDENDEYCIEVYEMNDDETELVLEGARIYPEIAGKRLNEIPFTCLGGISNSIEPQYPQIDTIAQINIGHYRNSADCEDSSYTVGQPTLVVIGVTDQWYVNVLKNKIQMGAVGGIPLPVGADAKIIQAQPNILPRDLMKDKEGQMIALGAKIIEPSKVVKTATESTMEKSDENSILTSTSSNVSDAITAHLKWSYLFITGKKDEEYEKICYKLLTESALTNMTANERLQTVADWQAKAISTPEMRQAFMNAGIAFDPKYTPPEPVDPMQASTMANGGGVNNKPKGDANGTVNSSSGRNFMSNDKKPTA